LHVTDTKVYIKSVTNTFDSFLQNCTYQRTQHKKFELRKHKMQMDAIHVIKI